MKLNKIIGVSFGVLALVACNDKMDYKEYKQMVIDSEKGSLTNYPKILHAMMGMNGEAGECIDILKKNGVYDVSDALQYKTDNSIKSKFKFFPGLDQIGNDYSRLKGSIEELMEKALNDKKCVGFNTLGFFKNKVDNLGKSDYFGKSDGIYIKLNPSS